MNGMLPPELDRWVQERVGTGQFSSTDEAIRAGLLLLQREEERRTKLEALRTDVQAGIEQLDRGEGVDGEMVFEEVLRSIAAQRDQEGRSTSPGELVEEGLHRLQREEARREEIEELRREIQLGLDDVERGDLLDGEEVFRRAFERIAALEESRV
ncbi:MAG TPA: type II toxin-antitoxin system ParD family antitoxin [Longimicrobium sp.]|jgi:antitoxin ParD1/3/4